MTIEEIIRKHMEYCCSNIERLKKICIKLPPGKISCYEHSGHIYWRIIDENGNRKYLPKSSSKYARMTALRQKYEAEIADYECEQTACSKYLAYMERHGKNLDRLSAKYRRGFSELLKDTFKAYDEYVDSWLSSDYEKSTAWPENLRITTSQNFLVRSKAEALIAEGLFQLGIPARYEQIHIFGGEKTVPDFTILNPYTHEEKLIEYFGMMDNQEYCSSYIRKTAIYTRAGVIPDRDILYFYETNTSMIDLKYIRMRLENFISGGM